MQKRPIAPSAWNAFSKDKNSFLGRVFNASPSESDGLEEAIENLYRCADVGMPYMEVVDGPAQALSVLKAFGGRYPDLRKRNLADRFFKAAVESAGRMRRVLHSQLSPQDYHALRNMLFWDLNFQVSQAFADPVLRALSKSPLFGDLTKYRNANNPSISDWDWIGFYHSLHCHIGLQLDLPKGMAEFVFGGGMQLFAFDRVAVAYRIPGKISRDETYALHAEEEAAVAWPDGSRLYFHHGVPVPEKLVEAPDSISREDIMAENNAEVRRCYQEILGSERFGHLLGLQLLDAQTDQLGNDLKLFKTEYKDKLAGAYIYFAQVVCPSTQRKYFLCVPPHIKSAPEAVAWTFGKSAEEYRPEIET